MTLDQKNTTLNCIGVQPNSLFATVCYGGRVLDSPVYARDKTTIKTVDNIEGRRTSHLQERSWPLFLGILLADYVETSSHAEYYINLLDQFKQKIKEKGPGLAKEKVLFHQDNVPSQKAVKVMAKIHVVKFETVPCAPLHPI